MPKRTDLKTILILGAGPIVIGQGCEFDYSGTQACRILREEGIRVILINSNPATIMTIIVFVIAMLVMVRQAVVLREDAVTRERRAARLVEDRYASLIANASDVIMIVDPDGAPVTFPAWDYARERCGVLCNTAHIST